ncbi:CBS domain-containing protein [Actinomadura barringtoniae]|nr:CBS domain-containing protein [Actinomadura barringtoniae]
MMTTEPLTITPDDSMLMAWELMARAHVHHLPVVGKDGALRRRHRRSAPRRQPGADRIEPVLPLQASGMHTGHSVLPPD